jgi:Tol biopolymer transport system component
MLGEPQDGNYVSGPGTLRAVVRTTKEHHPRVYIVDSATDSSRLLLDPWAWRPKWSPDGKWIACETYGSPERPDNLGLVEVRSGRFSQSEFHGRLEDYKWSPDSRWLALELADPMGGFTVLGFFSLAASSFQPVDTLTLFADYDAAWSPNSHMLAVSKPTYTDRDNEDEVTQSDLWLMDTSKARCRLVEGKGFLADAPRWVDSTHVRYVRNVWKIDASGPSESIVVEIGPRGRHANAPH